MEPRFGLLSANGNMVAREGFGWHYMLSLPLPVSTSIQSSKRLNTFRAETRSF